MCYLCYWQAKKKKKKKKKKKEKKKKKDNNISVHTSGRYRQFILSAHVSVALNSWACDSRIDSDWVSMILSAEKWKWFQLYCFSVHLLL